MFLIHIKITFISKYDPYLGLIYSTIEKYWTFFRTLQGWIKMRYLGRIVASVGTLFIHFLYIFYYYFRDGNIEPVDLYSTPFIVILGYWAGLQFDKVKYLSEKDLLTGMYNRRFVIKMFGKITSLLERTHHKLFVLVIDCDNFKNINDQYGHNTGDKVLKMIGESLVGASRKSDIVARWGGDEFLVIGHYMEEAGLQIMLQRLENHLNNLSKQIDIPIAVSIGSAVFPNHSKDLFDLIRIADRNMYKCKVIKKSNHELNKKTKNK